MLGMGCLVILDLTCHCTLGLRCSRGWSNPGGSLRASTWMCRWWLQTNSLSAPLWVSQSAAVKLGLNQPAGMFYMNKTYLQGGKIESIPYILLEKRCLYLSSSHFYCESIIYSIICLLIDHACESSYSTSFNINSIHRCYTEENVLHL